jgi:hypothetical protein
MPDLYAIANALAARYASGVVTPPAGYQNIRKATAAPPQAMTTRPAVIVFPDTGEFSYFAGKRDSGHDFIVRFYFNEAGDLARDQVALLKWATVLVDQLRLSTQLGGTVTVARCDTWKIGYLTYGGKDYSGVELGVHVVVNEAWAAVA